MKNILQIIIFIGITLSLVACSNENANTEENRIALIEEVIMKSEHSDDIEELWNVESEEFGEVDKYNVRLTLKDNIMDEYSPLKLGEIFDSFPLIIEEDLILETGLHPLDKSNNNYEIGEYTIFYDGAVFTKNEYGIKIGNGTTYDPIAEQESYDRQQKFIEDSRKKIETNKHKVRRFDVQTMIHGETYVFRNKTRSEIESKYNEIWVKGTYEKLNTTMKEYGPIKGPSLDWSKVYIIKERD